MSRSWWIIVGAVLVGLTVALFWPCRANGFMPYWDDSRYLEAAEMFQPLNCRNVARVFASVQEYYQPITILTFVVERAFGPENSAASHTISVLLHALNVLLVVGFTMAVAARIPELSRGERAALVLVTGMVFAWHPMQVESVAWIAERKTLVCAAFMLGAVWAYLRAPSSRAWWWGATGLFVAALCSKPMAISLPGVVLALDIFPLRRWPAESAWKLIREKWLWFVLVAGVTTVTIIGQRHFGWVLSDGSFSVGARLLLATRALVFYLWKVMWPAWLSPFYPQSVSATIGDREFLVSIAAVTLLTAWCVWRCRRSPQSLALWLAMAALVLPMSGLVQTGAQAVADRYVYLAIVPIALGVVGVGVVCRRRFSLPGRIALLAVAAGEIVFFCVRTREQIPVWHDGVRLWQAAYVSYPNSGFVNFKLGLELSRENRFAEALPYAVQAVEQHDYVALPHSVLGMTYLRLQRPGEAVPELERSLELDPKSRMARFNLACAYAALQRTNEACHQVEVLLTGFPQAGPMVEREPIIQAVLADSNCQRRLQGLLPDRSGGAK